MLTLTVLLATSALSFISGILVWWAQSQQALDSDQTVVSVQPWLTIHGALNPLLCVLFGFLWATHMRAGWPLPKYRRTGLAMAVVFGGLILSGAGIYYAGAETARAACIWFHRVLGLVLPLVLLWHGIGSYRTAKEGEV